MKQQEQKYRKKQDQLFAPESEKSADQEQRNRGQQNSGNQEHIVIPGTGDVIVGSLKVVIYIFPELSKWISPDKVVYETLNGDHGEQSTQPENQGRYPAFKEQKGKTGTSDENDSLKTD